MTGRGTTLVLSTAAGAFLAAGLIGLAASPLARAGGDDGSPGADTDFMSGPFQNFGLFTNTSFADPGDNEFVATVFQGPMLNGSPLFTDILTSGADPSDSVGAAVTGVGAAGAGVAGETVNTFIVPTDPALDSTFALPFTDPFAELFTALLPLGF